MRISEIFYSIQGEGLYAGLPMAFVRFQGCPFRCTWCDSQYTWDFDDGEELTLEAVLEQVDVWGCDRVCVTGGEPLAHLRDFKALVRALKENGHWIEVETAGGHRLPTDVDIDSWVMDIKCPTSEMEQFNKYDQIAVLRPQDQIKFVVAGREDFDFALSVLSQHNPECPTLFSPVWGAVELNDLAEWIKNEAPDSQLSVQVHKYIWDPERRGV